MAKKVAAKETKPVTKDVAVVTDQKQDLLPGTLSSSSLAQFADYDVALFKDVKLDVAENRELFSNDILIPKVWLTQAMSDHRKQHDIKEGTFVDSQTLEVLTGVGEVLRFVVLKTFKRWHTFELVKKGSDVKKEFVSSEIMVWGKNHDLKYQDTVDGKDVVRRQVISAYVLLEKDAKLGVNKPYIIDFASSSKGAGRIMVSDVATLNNRGLPSFVGFFEMTAEEENFEENTAWVKKMKFGGYCPKEAMPFLIECYKSLGEIENQIVIDDNDLIKGEGETGSKAEKNVTGKADVANAKI